MSTRFADSLASSLTTAINYAQSSDMEREHLCRRAPNIIEWVTRPEYGSSPGFMGDGSEKQPPYWGSYQVLRDFFEIRCPLCNSDSPSCKGKSKAQLEDEVLLRYSPDVDDDVCPKCGNARQQFLKDKLFKGYHTFHGVAGMRCTSLKSTYVFSGLGLLRMGELVGDTPPNTFKDVEIPVADKADTNVATAVGHAGNKPVLHIKTSRGYRLDPGHDHRLLVVRADFKEEWVKASKLEVGDVLKLRVAAGMFGKRTLSSSAARVLGALVANGDVTDRYRARFDHGHEEVAALFRDDVCALKLACTAQMSKARDKDSFLVEVSGKNFVKWFRDLGLGPQKSPDKEVPLAVREGVRETVCDFLSGYFSCDGFAVLGSSGDGVVKPEVGFDTVSRELSIQIRLLLLNLGIITNSHERPTRLFGDEGFTGTTTYHVTIAAESIKKFSEKITFHSGSKAAALKACLDHLCSTERHPCTDGPSGSALFLRQVLQTIDLANGAYRDSLGRVYNGPCADAIGPDKVKQLSWSCRQGQRVLSQELAAHIFETCHKLLDPETARDLKAYADPRYLFVRVVLIEEGAEEPLGDLCVPSSESFVANGVVTHNSGKSQTVAYLGCYVEHVLLTIAHKDADHRGLQRYLGGPLSDQYDIAYVASSLRTGEESIWTKYRGARAQSAWFRRYVPWLKLQEKVQDTPEGMAPWEYSEAHAKIKNEAANLITSAFSANSDTIVGRTRILAAADEVGRMKNTDSALGADEVYRGLEHSLMTVRSAVLNRNLSLRWLGLMASVSSPTSIDDKAMRLLRDAENATRMFVFRTATWDFNPYQPRENFEEDFRKDPIGSDRDFGANPPMAASPLIMDAPSFEESAINWEATPTASFINYEFQDPTGRRYVGLKLGEAKLILGQAPRYVAFDPGKTFDAFAGACAHAEYDEDGRIVTIFDWIVRILPRQGYEVWFDGVFDMIKDLQKYATIQRVEFDHWHSSQIIQNIRTRLSIVSEPVETKDKHFFQFVRDAMSGRVRLLPPLEDDYDICPPDRMSPEGVALYEIERLDVTPEGKIENPRKGERRGWNSDDVARVIVHAHRMVQDIGFTEKFDDQSRRARRLRNEAIMQDPLMNKGGAVFSLGRGSKNLPRRGW